MSQAQKKESRNVFQEIGKIIREWTGVVVQERHDSMLESRIQKRCRELRLDSLEDYLVYLKKYEEKEKEYFIGMVTTHHTYFFREFTQFQKIQNEIIEKVLKLKNQKSNQNKLKIWVAACSKGQEVITLCLFLENLRKTILPGSWDYEIVATDIDSKSVEYAKNAVYPLKEIQEIPMKFLGNFFLRGTGTIEGYAMVKDDLLKKIHYSPLNLHEYSSYPSGAFDFIFCRNVFIYFDQASILSISKALFQKLENYGYFMIGLSESLHGQINEITSLGASIYTHKNNPLESTVVVSKAAAKNPDVSISQVPLVTTKKQETTKRKIRLLCVDDSDTILMILKKMFHEHSRIEVVGVAKDGSEVEAKIKECKPDLITLDIHMPVMTGVEYLEKHFKPGHPKVLVLSSVNRSDTELAQKCIKFGAEDYIEKPDLKKMDEKKVELENKIYTMVDDSILSSSSMSSSESIFQSKQEVNQKIRAVCYYSTHDHLAGVKYYVKQNSSKDLPVVFALNDSVLAEVVKEVPQIESLKFLDPKNLKNGKAYAISNTSIAQLVKLSKGYQSIFIYDGKDEKKFELVEKNVPEVFWILEEGLLKKGIKEKTDTFFTNYTSFYLFTKKVCRK